MNTQNPKLEIIRWLDHTSSGLKTSWQDARNLDIRRPAEMVTTGWVIKETNEYLIIVGTVCLGKYTVHSDFCIVKAAIVQRMTVPYELPEPRPDNELLRIRDHQFIAVDTLATRLRNPEGEPQDNQNGQ